jgi:hypothetical protein
MAENTEVPQEVVEEARGMGWVPKEEFRGDEGRWVDAATFVERGHTVLPLIKKQKEQMAAELQQVRVQLNELGTLYKATQETIGALQEFHKKNTQQKVEEARRQILLELKQAKKDGDVDLEVDLMDELSKADKALATAPPTPSPQEKPSATTTPPGLDPDLVAWMAKNKWYGVDTRRTALANGIASMLRADPENDGVVGSAFYERISEEIQQRESGKGAADKVNGARHTGSFGRGKAKPGYSDLEPEAKRVCDADAKNFVGPGRMFKTVDEWRQYYVDSVLGS